MKLHLKRLSLGYRFETDVFQLRFIEPELSDEDTALAQLYALIREACLYLNIEEDDIAKIDTRLQKLPYHVYNWYSDRIDIYTMNEEALLYIMQGDDRSGTYSAKTEKALKKMGEVIGR